VWQRRVYTTLAMFLLVHLLCAPCASLRAWFGSTDSQWLSCSCFGRCPGLVAKGHQIVHRLILLHAATPGRYRCVIEIPVLQVVDEADRLLRQAYQEWLPQVLAAIAHRAACAAAAVGSGGGSGGGGAGGGGWRRPVVKIVASATLTRDPSKIERLALHCPRYIAVSAEDHRSVFPWAGSLTNDAMAKSLDVSGSFVERGNLAKDSLAPNTLQSVQIGTIHQFAVRECSVFLAAAGTSCRDSCGSTSCCAATPPSR